MDSNSLSPLQQADTTDVDKRGTCVLLSAADRQLEYSVYKGEPVTALDDCLIQSVLFHETTVLPDIFPFISSAVYQQQQSSSRSRLELAVEYGAVVPAFRGAPGEIVTFADALQRIRLQGIKGLHADPDATAAYLDACLAKCNKRTVLHLPQDISENYARSMAAALLYLQETQSDDIPADQLLPMQKFEKATALLEQCQAFISVSKELTRSHFFTILLKELNKINPSGTSDFKDVKSHLMDHPSCQKDPQLHKAIVGFIAIANALYHLNMANSMGAQAYFSNELYSGHAVAGMVSALATQYRSDSSVGTIGTSKSTRPSGFLTLELPFPDVGQLLQISWQKLLEIRAEYGFRYFVAKQSWDPTNKSSEDRLQNTATKYAEAVCQQVAEEVPITKIALGKLSQGDKRAFAKFVKVVDTLIQSNHEAKTIFAGADSLSSMFYSEWKRRTIVVNVAR